LTELFAKDKGFDENKNTAPCLLAMLTMGSAFFVNLSNQQFVK